MNEFITTTAMSALDDPCSLQPVSKSSFPKLFVYLCPHPQIGVKDCLGPGKVQKLLCAFIRWAATEDPAVTLEAPGADSTIIHKAMEIAEKGDVVVDRCGDMRHACWGGLVTMAASIKGWREVLSMVWPPIYEKSGE